MFLMKYLITIVMRGQPVLLRLNRMSVSVQK